MGVLRLSTYVVKVVNSAFVSAVSKYIACAHCPSYFCEPVPSLKSKLDKAPMSKTVSIIIK